MRDSAWVSTHHRPSVVAVELQGRGVSLAASVAVLTVVEVAERHVLRHIGRGAHRLCRLLVARLHKLDNALRRFNVSHDRGFGLK